MSSWANDHKQRDKDPEEVRGFLLRCAERAWLEMETQSPQRGEQVSPLAVAYTPPQHRQRGSRQATLSPASSSKIHGKTIQRGVGLSVNSSSLTDFAAVGSVPSTTPIASIRLLDADTSLTPSPSASAAVEEEKRRTSQEQSKKFSFSIALSLYEDFMKSPIEAKRRECDRTRQPKWEVEMDLPPPPELDDISSTGLEKGQWVARFLRAMENVASPRSSNQSRPSSSPSSSVASRSRVGKSRGFRYADLEIRSTQCDDQTKDPWLETHDWERRSGGAVNGRATRVSARLHQFRPDSTDDQRREHCHQGSGQGMTDAKTRRLKGLGLSLNTGDGPPRGGSVKEGGERVASREERKGGVNTGESGRKLSGVSGRTAVRDETRRSEDAFTSRGCSPPSALHPPPSPFSTLQEATSPTASTPGEGVHHKTKMSSSSFGSGDLAALLLSNPLEPGVRLPERESPVLSPARWRRGGGRMSGVVEETCERLRRSDEEEEEEEEEEEPVPFPIPTPDKAPARFVDEQGRLFMGRRPGQGELARPLPSLGSWILTRDGRLVSQKLKVTGGRDGGGEKSVEEEGSGGGEEKEEGRGGHRGLVDGSLSNGHAPRLAPWHPRAVSSNRNAKGERRRGWTEESDSSFEGEEDEVVEVSLDLSLPLGDTDTEGEKEPVREEKAASSLQRVKEKKKKKKRRRKSSSVWIPFSRTQQRRRSSLLNQSQAQGNHVHAKEKEREKRKSSTRRTSLAWVP